jgi:hypothetical protein
MRGTTLSPKFSTSDISWQDFALVKVAERNKWVFFALL